MQSKWIVSKKYDLFFFIGSVVFSWLFLFIYNLNPFPEQVPGTDLTFTAIVIYFTFTALFDHPHIFQMVSRIYYDKIEFQRRRLIYTWGLLGFVIVGWLIIFFNIENIWSNIYATVGAWHIVGQNLGFFKIYKAKAGQPKDILAKFEGWAFVSLSLVALLQYFRPIEGEKQNLVWHVLKIPEQIFLYLDSIVLLIIGFLLWVVLIEIRHKRFSAPKWLFALAIIGTEFFLFSQTYVPLIVLVVLETAYHDIQYQGWTGLYQKKRFGSSRIVRNFFIMAMVYGLLMGLLEYSSEVGSEVYNYLFMPFTMFVFFHYCMDGKIWKVSSSPELKDILK